MEKTVGKDMVAHQPPKNTALVSKPTPAGSSGGIEATKKRSSSVLNAKTMQALQAQSEALSSLFETFWGIPLHFNLFSISEIPLYCWQYEDFYASQAGINNSDNRTLTLKLSDSLCSSLLTTVLGSRTHLTEPFSFRATTGFEKSLIAGFNKELLIHFLKKWTLRNSAPSPQGKFIHVAWSILPKVSEFDDLHHLNFREKPEMGYLILSLPEEALKIPGIEDTDFYVTPSFFDDAYVPVHLHVGSTQVHLSDLQSLEVNDTVILEESSIERLRLLTKNDEIDDIAFPIKMANQQALQSNINVPLTQETNTMAQQTETSTQSAQALWDNLMIDVNAEFEPIKIPLKQLKEMSEGLVVEVGDIIQNAVNLKVEGKVLAKGSLVIVDNKFALRIQEMVAESESTQLAGAAGLTELDAEQSEQQVDSIEEKPKDLPEIPKEQDEASAESDLDDFLNDDFDDDDDEEWS